MWRFLAGVVSALMLAGAGFLLWSGLAKKEQTAPAPPPQVAAADAPAADPAVPAPPPQADEATREQKRFSRYDRNDDGAVDRDEYLLLRRKAFARLDTDGNGSLSFDEYAVKTIQKFAKADADKSGRLDGKEFATTRVVRKARPACPPARRAEPAPAAAEGEDY